MDNNYILQVKGICKEFPGVKALDDVTFNIKKGTIHALVGENGAGKSTLIKILAGIYQVYSGDIILDGETVKFASPSAAQQAGISVVHQELKLAEELSIAENIFLGSPIRKSKGIVDWGKMNEEAQKLTDSLNISLDVHQPVKELSIAKKQIVEICKAIAHDCKLLIMDEPSATLTNNELNVLFDAMGRLKEQGVTILYISHRMEEIFKLADEVSVLRDGRYIGTEQVSQITQQELVNMMVGRELNVDYPHSDVVPGEVILKVKNLTAEKLLKDISFDLRRGEILGVAGLVGAGRTELMRAIVGIDTYKSGEIEYLGKKVKNKSFRKAILDGFGFVPEDRKKLGTALSMSIKENICMTDYPKISKGGVVNSRKLDENAETFRNKLRIVCPSTEALVGNLSGGNQQKVVIAKWLYRESDILIMDEPTRGIDVGAKREIYDLMVELTRQGKTIIMISSELPEVLGVSNRIIVLHEGRKVGEMSAEEATQEKVMSLCV